MCDGMVNREKVISDLEEQIAWIRDNDFHKFPGWGHAVLAMRDALALLKAIDVTPEELERLKMCRAECKIDCLLEHYNKVKDELDAMKKAQEPV